VCNFVPTARPSGASTRVWGSWQKVGTGMTAQDSITAQDRDPATRIREVEE